MTLPTLPRVDSPWPNSQPVPDLWSTLNAATWTAAGRGAIAVWQLQGPSSDIAKAIDRWFVPKNRRPWQAQPVGSVVYGDWQGEDLVAMKTSETVAEIQCHGGPVPVARIEQQLRESGASLVTWMQQAESRSGFLSAECWHAFRRASTATAAKRLAMVAQQFPQAIEELGRDAFDNSGATGLIDRLQSWLNFAEFGQRLAEGWRVVLLGAPNVGKSSLMNTIVGYERAIVYPEPGTTRDSLTANTAFEGWPIQLCDTAGLRTTTDEIEQAGVERSLHEETRADLVLHLFEGGAVATLSPNEQRELVPQDGRRRIMVLNKSDLLTGQLTVEPLTTSLVPAVSVSAKTGEGIEQLMSLAIQRLIPQIPPDDALFPVTLRQTDCLKAMHHALQTDNRDEFLVAQHALRCGSNHHQGS